MTDPTRDHHTNTEAAAAAYERNRADTDYDTPPDVWPCHCGRWCRTDIPCDREPVEQPCDQCRRPRFTELLDGHGVCTDCRRTDAV